MSYYESVILPVLRAVDSQPAKPSFEAWHDAKLTWLRHGRESIIQDLSDFDIVNILNGLEIAQSASKDRANIDTWAEIFYQESLIRSVNNQL